MLDRTKSPELRSFDNLRFDYPDYVMLPNGVKLYVVNNSDQPVNRLELICRGGVMEEDKPLQSLALTSMFIHGSDEWSSAEVAEKLDYCGAYASATSSDNFTQLQLNSLNHNFKEVLPIMRSIVANPAIPEREFEVFKAQVKSAYQTARERVKYLAQTLGRKMYYGASHPLSHRITDEDVDSLHREDVLAFHKRYYHPENMALVLSGCVGDEELKLVEEYFGKDEIHTAPADIKIIERLPCDERFMIEDKPDALQSAVYMIHEGVPRYHHDYVNLRILVTALGGYFGSRLMQNIREDKGYTYGINSMLMGRRSEAKIVVATECDTAYTAPLIEEVKREVLRLQEELMSEEELMTVKNCMLSDLAKTLDSPFAMASCVGSNLLYATGEDYFNRQVRDIDNITPEMLQEVAKRYLDAEKFYIAVAGDKKLLSSLL